MLGRSFRLACARLFCGALGFALSSSPATGQEAPKRPEVEIVQEWDAYYSSIGLYVPLTEDPYPDGGRLSETEVYRQLFERSYRPNVLLLEASVYPMPILGVWARSHQAGLYDSASLGRDLNLIQTVTAGFQEPWAVSAFFGSQMKFTRPGEEERGTNRAHMGYLVSAGTKHIKDNVLIDDDWLELEWKMKGERNFRDDRLSWSFRMGGRLNRNPGVADTFYVGVRRSNLDFKSPFLTFLDNSRIDLLTEFATDRPMLLRQELIFGKKYPMEGRRMAWEIDFGIIYERASKYTGDLAPLGRSAYTLVIRPNLAF